MKKTQSLKLMLLGLFAAVSTSALAQDEAHTYIASGGVIYDITGDEAVVVGVNQVAATNKKIEIADEVGSPAKKVTSFAEDWINSGKVFANTPTGTIPAASIESQPVATDGSVTINLAQGSGTVSTQTFPTIDATEIEGLVLNIYASEMKSISRADIEGLQIRLFGLGKNAGITVIPRYLFANVTFKYDVVDAAKKAEAEGKLAQYDKDVNVAQAKLDGTVDMYGNDYAPGLKKERDDAKEAWLNAQAKTAQGKGSAPATAAAATVTTKQNAVDAATTLRDKAILYNLAQLWSVCDQATVDALLALDRNAATDKDKYDAVLTNMIAAQWPKTTVTGKNGYDPVNTIDLETAVTNAEKELQDAIDAYNNVVTDVKDQYGNDATIATLEQEEADAKTAYEAAQAAVDAQQKIIDDIENEGGLRDQAEKDLYDATHGERVEYGDANKTLEKVNLFNNFTGIEEYAFYDCENAEFSFDKTSASTNKVGKFPATLTFIEKNAFADTQLKNLDLSETGNADWRGATDKDGKIIPDGEVDRKDRLNDNDIAASAFAETPLKGMILNTTLMTPDWVKTVAQNLEREKVAGILFCDWEDAKDMMMNNTLATATLPDLGIEFDETADAGVYDFVAQNTFVKCWALTSVAIPAYVTEIGGSAFQYTNIDKFDLTALEGLKTIGGGAFARNPSLTSVKFAQKAPLTRLSAKTFTGACALEEVVFNDAMETLAEGLFQTNALKELNLCNTAVTRLENLFKATPETEISKPDKLGPNTTLVSVCLPENLEEIAEYAFASCWGLGTDAAIPGVEIPGNVSEMGDGVFFNAKNLKEVTIMDSELCGLPPHTFSQCSNLETVIFVTLETISCGFGDNCFFGAGTETELDPTDNLRRTVVYVGYDSWLEWSGSTQFPSTYAKLMPYQTSIKGNLVAGMYVKPWTSKYGTWIEANGKVGVFSAYQDGHRVILYPAKKSTYTDPITNVTKQYYKIAAFDKDVAYSAMDRWNIEQFLTMNNIWDNGDGTYDYPYGTRLALPDGISMNDIVYKDGEGYGYWGKDIYGNDQFFAVEAFKGIEEGKLPNVADVPAVIPNAKVPDDIDALVKARLSFGSKAETLKGITLPTEILAKSWMAAGTAIIMSTEETIPYLQKTNPGQRYQSTVDLANQLVVAYSDVPADNNTNFYYYAEVVDPSGQPDQGWVHHNDPLILKIIPENGVCFMQTTENGQGARDILNVVIVSENEATAIGGVTEYVSAKNGDVIYNLQGVKVLAPVKGQMYIQSGKKFIQK